MVRALTIMVLTALAGIALVCCSAPWQQVATQDPSVVQQSLGYAPFWTQKFQHVPGAQIDSDQFALYIIVIVILAIGTGICAYIILGQPWWRRPSRSRQNHPRRFPM